MKRRLALLVCIIATVAMVFALASCGGDDCEHTYSTEYTTDANGHWYVSTCGCEGEVSNYGAHVDSNNDGKCDTCKYVLCAHTYETEWSTDENNHWNASNCDCTATKANEAKHADENKDGICDVCKYVVCTHEYSDWKTDETKHWKEATCGCTVANTNEGAHADENKDGNCDTCAYVMCAHTFATEWSTDGAYHWYAATCGCNVEGSKAEHTNEDGDKLCDVCEANICEHTYADVLSYDETNHWYASTCGCDVKKDYAEHTWAEELSKDGAYHYYATTCGCDVKKDVAEHTNEDEDVLCDVCGGKVLADVIASINPDASIETNESVVVKGENEASVKYYDNYIYIVDAYGNEKYVSFAGDNGEILFCANVSYGEVSRDLDFLEVILYNYSALYYNVEATTHEQFITALYTLGTTNESVYGFEAGENSFSYAYIYVSEWGSRCEMVVEVSFTLDEETNGIASATVSADWYYTEGSIIVDTENNTYTVSDTAVADNEERYTITQTFGEALDSTEEPNPYKAEDYLISDLEIFVGIQNDNYETVLTETQIKDGDTVKVGIGYANGLIILVGADDADVADLNKFTVETIADTGYSNYPMRVYSNEASTYAVTVSNELDSISFTVVVEYSVPTDIDSAYIDADNNKVVADTATMYTGSSMVITSSVASGANPAIVATLPDGATAAIVDNEDGTYKFTPVMAGEYVITITSAVAEEVSTTLTVTVVAPPAISDVVNGTYEGGAQGYYASANFEVVFTPAEEGATEGTVVVKLSGHELDMYWERTEFAYNTTFTYTYNSETGVLALTKTEGDDMELELYVKNYNVYAFFNGAEYKLAKKVVTPEEPAAEATPNPFTVTITDNNCYIDKFTFVAGEAGTYTFTVPAGAGITTVERDEAGTAPYVDHQQDTNGGTFSLELAAGEKVNFLVGATEKNIDVSISFVVEAAAGLTGTYNAADDYGNNIEVVITSDTITFTPAGSEEAISYTYEYENGIATYYDSLGIAITMPMQFSLTITEGTVTGMTYNGTGYTLTKKETSSTATTGLEGTYNAADDYGNNIEVVITSDTITFTPAGSEEAISYTYEYKDGQAIYFDSLGLQVTMGMQFSLTITDGAVTGMTYNGTGYTLTKA